MKLTRFARLFALPAVFALTTLAAHADTFNWALTGPDSSLGGFPETGSGTLTATLLSGNEWAISAITGTVGGSAITGLNSFNSSDNMLFPESSILDTQGLSFETANGELINIFSFYSPSTVSIPAGNNFGEIIGGTGAGFGVGTFSVTQNSPVPEPATILMLSTGLIGAAGAMRRKLSRV